MHTLAHDRSLDILVRRGASGDIDDLLDLEAGAFTTDHLSRKSFRRFVCAPNADLLVAERGGVLCGYILVLFRSNSAVARLYSIAVAPRLMGRGLGQTLLAATEAAARSRNCRAVRLEVAVHNAGAIRVYEKAGYCLRGRAACYYEDGGDALRYEKMLVPPASRPR
jgi:ribosomal protein S18 acetylase RimI-like enzyme